MTGDDPLGILEHELRSPVAALEGLASGARGLASPGLTRVVELAASAGRDIERLLCDPDLLSLRPEEIELSSLLESVAQPGVSCSADPLRFVCDPTRMRQALANLVANARRHGTAVTVSGCRRDDRIVIEVADDGPGVVAGVDVFERGVSSVGSSGYGLWLARAIAEAHGGTLTLEAAPNEGTTFSLSVPSPPVASG